LRVWPQKIATPSASIKLAAVAAAAFWFGGCGGGIPEAPFPARPDTVAAGDLRGPFDGRVIDAASGKPIEGAAVLGSWAYESGLGMAGPAASASVLVETDADGRYEVARLDNDLDPRARLDRFTLVVYKRGYLAWRSDRRFEDLSARHDFAQTGNLAKLDKLPGDVSHARHLRFVGAGGPLLPRLGWELHEAAGQALGGKGSEKPPEEVHPTAPLLDATPLLSADELKAVTRFPGPIKVGKLGDLPTTPLYDSVHFAATGQPEKFDAAIRLYHLAPAEAEKQFEKLLKEVPAATEKGELGDRSLRGREGEIYAVAALDRARGFVLVFTCGLGQCEDFAAAVGLAKRMWARLDRTLHPPELAAPPPPEEPVKSPELKEPDFGAPRKAP
jgi:hypothetical protein